MEREQLTLEQLADLFLAGKISKQELDKTINSKNYSKNQEQIKKKTYLPEDEIEGYFSIALSYYPTDHKRYRPCLTFSFEGKETGYACFRIDSNTKNILWEEFFPYDLIPGLRDKHLALGSIAHTEALLFLSGLLKDPQEYTISHRVITREREEHLLRMGEEKQMTLHEAVSNAVDYVTEKGFYSSPHTEKIIDWFVPHQK